MSKVLVDRGLLPCPFCGQQDAFVEQLDSDASMVICQGMVDEHSACLARGPVGVQQSDMEDQPGRNAAIANWNRRAQPAEAGGVDRWLHQEGEHHQHPDGEWMLYADHIAALSAERTRADVAAADANDAERALAAVTAERDRLAKQASKFRLVERAMEALGCDEREGGIVTAASLILISSAHRMNAKRGVIDQEGVTLDDGCIGDWRVTIERISAAMAAKEA